MQSIEHYAGLNCELASLKALTLSNLFKDPDVVKAFGVCEVSIIKKQVSDGTSYNNLIPGYFLVVTTPGRLSEKHLLGIKDVLTSV